MLDRPTVVTFVLLGIVLVHFLASAHILPSVAPLVLFGDVPERQLPSALTSLATGLAGVAALVGGFAGVVVVFGLSSNDERFRQVRLKASTSLQRNWMSIVTTPILAAFGSIIGATLATATWIDAALWLLEICLLFAAHGAIRLIVLLFELVKVVHAADEAAQAETDSMTVEEFYGD